MDQALHSASRTYGIIGDGRVATHVVHYFTLLGIPFRQWSRSDAAAKGVDPTSLLRATVQECTHVLLLIKDGEIEPFIRMNPFLQSRQLIHCSGRLVTELAVGYHPLFSFSRTLYDRSTYESIPVVCEAGRPTFRDAFPLLPNPSVAIERSLKPYYHALCVLSGNFTTLVWQKTFNEFENRLGIPHSFASSYLGSIVHNLVQSPTDALTGPLARKDTETIRSNLAALKGDPYVRLYEAVLEIVKPV